MPKIRELTPADYADMCDIADTHSSPASAYQNRFDAPEFQNFPTICKDYIWSIFQHSQSNFFGYFTDEGKLVAFANFLRWKDGDNFTIGIRMEDRTANLPRRPGSRFSEALVDCTNWGLGFFRSEGQEFAWALAITGTEDGSMSSEPNCLLSTYERVLILDLPPNTPLPDEYVRVSWGSLPYPTRLYRFRDPMPLVSFTERMK